MSDDCDREVANVLLSIKPRHATDILRGHKWWEYRRVAPTRGPPIRVVLYATAPVQAAVGACWVPCIKSGHPATVVAQTIDETPSEPDDVLEYFDGSTTGSALRVMGQRRFESRVTRSSLEAAGVPPVQNFRYLPSIDPVYAEQPGVTV